jgi:UDP-GlcNAc:undecaprenyl-phosphate GlcNAc-1-phosphate transferase
MTILGIVGVCNSINMVDGLDGLAGGISLTAFSAFAFLSFISDKPVLMLLSMSICWSLLAFLIYNWNPASYSWTMPGAFSWVLLPALYPSS